MADQTERLDLPCRLVVAIGVLVLAVIANSCNLTSVKNPILPTTLGWHLNHVQRATTEDWAYCRLPTTQLLHDLLSGEGKAPPSDTPYDYFNASGHGWIEEGTDLSRVAMQILSERDKQGLLTSHDQRSIDQLALSEIEHPVKTPGQFYTRQYLCDRWLAGKLPADELKQFYDTAIRVSIITDPAVTEGNEVPLRLQCRCFVQNSISTHWELLAHYKSIRIDGQTTSRTNRYYVDFNDPDWAFRSDGAHFGDIALASLPAAKLGKHQLEVELGIDIVEGFHTYPDQRPILYSEVLVPKTEFEVTPASPTLAFFRLLQNPIAEGLRYMPVPQLQTIIENRHAPLLTLAMQELMRRCPLAEVTPTEQYQLVTELLKIQGDRSRKWFPEYGNFIEWLHENRQLDESQWKKYGDQQFAFRIFSDRLSKVRPGDSFPLGIEQAERRGNSRPWQYTGDGWNIKLHSSFSVPSPVCVMNVMTFFNQYAWNTRVSVPDIAAGTYEIRVHLADNELSGIVPDSLPIPAEYDLGTIELVVVPKTFDVILISAGDKKIQVIKEVRTATGLGLKEAKDLVEGAPKTIKEALSKEDAEKLKKTLEDQGATVELK